MQVNLNTITCKPIYFRADKRQNTVSKEKTSTSKVKPFLYLGASIIPIGIGILGIKKGVKNLEIAYQNRPPAFLNYLLPEEKPIVQQILKDGLDPKLAEVFTKLKNIEDKEIFAREAYDALMKQTGYDGLKPTLKIENYSDHDNAGAWNPLTFEMEIYKNPTLNGPKFSILSTINHEIEHFKQDCTILRTEGLGADAIVDAMRKKLFNLEKKDEKRCLEVFKKTPETLTENDIEEIFNLQKDRAILRIHEPYYKKAYGVVSQNSEEGKMAKKYLEATENYTNIDPKASTSEKWNQEKLYESNLLEKMAFAAGDRMRDAYQDFIIRLADARSKK